MPPARRRVPQCQGKTARRGGKAQKLRRTRESVSSGVVNSSNLSNILSELRNVCQMPLLSGRLGSRKPVQGVAERFVVHEEEELSAFHHQAKVADGGVDSQQPLSKGL